MANILSQEELDALLNELLGVLERLLRVDDHHLAEPLNEDE